MRPRLVAALTCYGVLAVLSFLTIDDIRLRALALVALAAFALKTWIADVKERQ